MPLTARTGGVSAFLLLITLASAPLWALGALTPPPWLPEHLPVSALITFVPAIAGVILVGRDEGWRGARSFILRAFDAARCKRAAWWIVALAFMPAALAVEFVLLRAIDAAPAAHIDVSATLPFFALFLLCGVGEELGWQGYLFPRLQAHTSALSAALLIGVFWAVWHIVPFLQGGRAGEWIFWQCLTMLPLRVITAWLFVNGGASVLLISLFHAAGNVAQFQFPNGGSHYNPAATFWILTAAAVLIVVVWGPKLQARPTTPP